MNVKGRVVAEEERLHGGSVVERARGWFGKGFMGLDMLLCK